MTTCICIRFIRMNGSTKTDDKIVIRRIGMNQFTLSYTYGDTNSKNMHKLVLTDNAVFRWMRHTIRLLEKDNEPFQGLQMDLPFMPSVFIEIKNLDSAYNALLDAIEFHLDNWPRPVLNPEEESSPRQSAGHLFFD